MHPFFGANLIALRKKDGGVRPIAVGCTLRRLVAKCANSSVEENMAKLCIGPLYGWGLESEEVLRV